MKPHLLLFGFLLATVSLQAKNYNSPYGFYENKGQIIDQNNNLNPSVKYLWTGNGMKVQLKGNSFSYEVMKTEKFEYRNPKHKVMLSLSKHRKAAFDDSTIIYSHRVDIELLNSNPHPQIIAEEKSADYDNYYTTGTPEEGVTFVYHYSKVTYKDIYPNIDLEFISDAKNEKGFKYNFIVHPGGNVANIQLQYKGATNTSLNKQGNLAVATTSGDFEESIPKSYVAETGENVTVQYAAKGGNIFGFQANAYASNQTLIIDPWITYYGIGGNSAGEDIVVDNQNFIYIVGETQSLTNIASTGSYQGLYGGVEDVFLTKFNTAGQRVWGTYYGNTGQEAGYGICKDANNDVYVTGTTTSTSGIATSGAYQTTILNNNTTKGFITKFNTTGQRLWGTYVGGINSDETICNDITISSTGKIYISGIAYGSSGIATGGVFQPNYGGGVGDAFIMKYDSLGTKVWGTYYGGNLDEEGCSICTDNNENIYITGWTMSIIGLTTSGCLQSNFSGNNGCAYITKFDSSGSIQWGTYFGGTTRGYSIKTDNLNNVYVCGSALSVPATSGAYQTNCLSSGGNGFLVKLSSSCSILWCTYYGGNIGDGINDFSFDSNGNIYLAGVTYSTSNISTSGSYQTNLAGSYDGFFAKINPSGSFRFWGSYFGGSSQDKFTSIAVDNYANIYLTGKTNSLTNFSTSNAYQTIVGQTFIASFDSTGSLTTTPPVTNNTIASAQTICSNVQPALLTGSSPSGGSGTFGYLWLQSTTSATSGFIAASGSNNTQNYQPLLLSATTWYKRVVMSGNAVDTSAAVQITVNAAPNASITAGGATTFCQGASVTLNANTSAGFNYQWYDGATLITNATNSNYSAATGGSYTVLISNSNNCTDTSNAITVTVNPVPTASIAAGGNTTICNGEGVNLNAQTATGYTYQWYNGNSIITGATNATYLANTSGSYTVMVDLGSCSDTSNAIVVTVNALPSVIITQTVDTFYSNGSFNTYQWYLNGTAIAGATNPNYTATQNGNYYVMVTDANNCSGQSNTILFTVGIDEVGEDHLFSVSPNPFKESFVVKCASAKGSLMIVDIVGKVVKSVVVKSVITTIDMKGYAAGVYLVKYEDGEVCETVKFVKE